MKIEDLFAAISKQARVDSEAANTEVEKTASEATPPAEETKTEVEVSTKEEDMEKTASELYAGGQLFAEGFADRLIEKLAGSGVSAAGRGDSDPSGWTGIAKKIDNIHKRKGGAKKSGGSVGAEEHGAISGAKGVVNTAKPLV